MNIQDWLEQTGNRQADLSRLTGLSPPEINKIIKGKMGCSLRVAVKLERATKGSVRLEDSCPEMLEVIEYIENRKSK